MTTFNFFLAILAVLLSISGYLADGNLDDDDYDLSLLKQYLINQRQLKQELQQLAAGPVAPANLALAYKPQLAIDTEKRAKGCIKRNAICNEQNDNCCAGSTCRCTLIGSNCRCQRPGLFQKFFK